MEEAGDVAVVYGASKTDKGDPINQPWYSIITTNHQKHQYRRSTRIHGCVQSYVIRDITDLEFSQCIVNDENLKSL